ncbi:MAG: histidine--tRNA ligase [Candidatus Omnitrophica bacterium]|nr:histidine--tRNA ligase [Candidatus Omnitrophota bacterium]
MKFKRLRGMHDVFGKDALGFDRVERIARDVFARFGFQELLTPIMEEKELFTRALGTETDVVQKEMYEFTDRSKTLVALRPEGTAGIVRAYLENHFDKTEGQSKFFYSGPMFRSERPQAGRLRQFHQIGVESLGVASPYADAETIQCLAVYFDSLGIKGYEIKLNNLGTFEEREAFKKVLTEYFKPREKELCEDCKARLSRNVFRLLDCKTASCRVIVERSPEITSHLGEASKKHFDAVRRALDGAGVVYQINARMARGLDYYTKTVFEVTHASLGAQDALAAGGRYDRLVESFGGAPTGAVGFAIGVERLLMCLAEQEAGQAVSSFFVATLGEAALQKGFEVLSTLRAAGIQVQMDFEAKSLKSQMRTADKIHCRYVVILGDNEIQKGVFNLKDMKEGAQEEHALNDAVKILKGKG